MWMVEILGDKSDIEALAQSLTSKDITISKEDQRYILTSDQFAVLADANTVYQKANNIVTILNGAARLALGTTHAIRMGAVYRWREDGKHDTFVFPEPAVSYARASSPTVILTHSDGTVETFRPADPVKQWAMVAFKDDEVFKVFQILAGGMLDWVNLYRIMEIVASDISKEKAAEKAISEKGWATSDSIKLFKHTANSPKTLGLDARHGATNHQPPSNPMSISEARSLIESIAHAWLRSKTSASAP